MGKLEEAEMSMEEILSSIRKYVVEEKSSPHKSNEDMPERHTEATEEYDDDEVIHLTSPLDEAPAASKPAASKPQQPEAQQAPQPAPPPKAAAQPETKASSPVSVSQPPPAANQATAPLPKGPSPEPHKSAFPEISKTVVSTPNLSTLAPQPQPQVVSSPSAAPQPAPVSVAPQPATTAPQPAAPAPAAPQPVSTPAEQLMSAPQVVSASAQALSRLVEAAKTPSQLHKATSNTTVEQMVTDVTRSLVKEWLDKNLSNLVETMVAQEIDRIAKEILDQPEGH